MGAATLSSDPPQPKHSNLYVSGLGSLQTEAEIVDLFSSYGHVETCRLVRNARDTKTFAFVKFSTIPESLAAIAGLNKKTVAGAVLEVKTADAGDRELVRLLGSAHKFISKHVYGIYTPTARVCLVQMLATGTLSCWRHPVTTCMPRLVSNQIQSICIHNNACCWCWNQTSMITCQFNGLKHGMP